MRRIAVLLRGVAWVRSWHILSMPKNTQNVLNLEVERTFLRMVSPVRVYEQTAQLSLNGRQGDRLYGTAANSAFV